MAYEYVLWEKYKNGNDEKEKKRAKEEIILNYVELVKIIAGRLYNYYASNIEYEDLVSYGVIGLIDAIEKYDHTKEIKFETYSSIRIRGSIIDQIRALDWIPRSIRQKSKLFKETYSKMELELGRSPSVEELGEKLQKTPDEINKMISEISTFNMVSLEDEINDTVKVQIKDEKNHTPEEALVKKDTIDRLKKGIEKLNQKEQMVIDLYYNKELTYKEIAVVLDVSESRISQIHSKSIIKIRNHL